MQYFYSHHLSTLILHIVGFDSFYCAMVISWAASFSVSSSTSVTDRAACYGTPPAFAFHTLAYALACAPNSSS